MKKRILIAASTVLIMVSLLLISPTTPNAAPAVTLKAITFLPKNDLRVVQFLDFLKLVEQKSHGEVSCKFLGSQEVIPALQVGENLKMGNVDIAMLPGAFFQGLVPGASMISLSQVSHEEERKRGLWDKLAQMCAPAGLYPIGKGMPQNDPLIYIGFKRLRPASIKDLGGLKIGYSATLVKRWINSLGMTFVQLPNPEFYTGLERGVVDGLSLPLADHLVYSIYELESCLLDHAVSVSNMYLLMSLKTWSRLPKNLQENVTEAYLAWLPQTIKAQREDEDNVRKALMSKKGKDFFVKLPPDDARLYVQSFYDAEWAYWEKTKPDLAKMLKPLLAK
jgi:TRAP-type transport system periplasmic protein